MKIEKTGLILFLITIISAFIIFNCNPNPQLKNEININQEDNSKKELMDEEKKKQMEIEKAKQKEEIEKISSLRVGSKGAYVSILQNKLNKFGYNLPVDGVFGNSTETAIYHFQHKNKISCDGIPGKITLEKLNLKPTKETIYNPKEDIFRPMVSSNYAEEFINNQQANSSTDYYIWVNTKTTKTHIFKGYNHHWKLIKTMLCTVGRASSPTIKGTFFVGDKGESFVVKNNPSLMCKYYTQINGNYLFHTVLLYRNGKIANNALGAKMSHGCIRLSIEDAKYIYDSIPKGSGIYIS